MAFLFYWLTLAKVCSASLTYQVDTWGANEGLPQSSVTSIIQSSDGYLWLGTQNGLVRFDGIHFKVFDENNTPAIKNSRVVRLFRDRADALWVGTEQSGLVCLKNGQFRAYEVPGRQTTFNYPRVFCEDGGGSLWLVSCEWQLIRLSGERFEVPSMGWNLSGSTVRAVAADEEGKVWVGTENELAVRDGETFRRVWPQQNEKNSRVEFLASSRSGGVWVAVDRRLRKFEAAGWDSDLGDYAWTRSHIYDLYEDSKNRLWVATMGEGVFRYDRNGEILHLTKKDGLPTDSVRCVTEDREGNVWVGTEGGGLCRLKPAIFQTVGVRQGLASDQVISMVEAEDGSLWVGSNGHGLDRLKDGQVRHYGSDQGVKNGHVWSVLQDRQGTVWVGTWDGLFKGGVDGFVGMSDGKTIGWQVLALYEDSQSRLCAGLQAFGGISRVQGTERTVIRIPGVGPSLDVRVMVEDRDGNFWIGTNEEGLYRMKDGRFTRFGKKDGLGSDSIWCLHVDEEGVLWVGTCRGGLSRWRNGRFTTWTVKEGLVNNVICQILEDRRGHLWIGSYGGVFRIDKAELNHPENKGGKIQCVRYGTEDGLPSIECQGGFQPSGCQTRDGRLWFPTVKGLAAVDPESVIHNALAPPVVIEDVILDGQVRTREALATKVAGYGASQVSLQIPAGTRRIGFRYTALSFTAPKQLRFKYRLEGLGQNWEEAGTGRTADFTYVPPGDYRFRVIACNNSGVWNEEGAGLNITVLPYFWQTKWFLALAALTILGGVVGTARSIVARKLKRQIERAQWERAIEAERARIARDMHDDLGASLTEIAFLSELAQKPEALPPQAHADMGKIAAKARKLTGALDEIVWAVDPRNDTLENFVTYACNFAEEYLRGGKIALRLDLPDRLPEVRLTSNMRHNLFLVLKEALNNILKHASASEVWISVAVQPALFTFTIKDNGKGFLPGSEERSAALRNGLANMRKRIESIGGRFELNSQPDHGTTLRLTIGPSS